MINFLTGAPRSGKSYLATWWIWNNYVHYDDALLKNVMNEGVTIVANDGILRAIFRDWFEEVNPV